MPQFIFCVFDIQITLSLGVDTVLSRINVFQLMDGSACNLSTAKDTCALVSKSINAQTSSMVI